MLKYFICLILFALIVTNIFKQINDLFKNICEVISVLYQVNIETLLSLLK